MSTATLRWSAEVCVLTALAVVAPPRAEAGVIEVKSSRDTTVFQNNPNNSLGGGVTVYAGTNSSNFPRRGLVAFDLSGIPEDSTINNVHLDLVLADVSGGETTTTRTIGVHKLLGDWGEGTILLGQGPGGTGQGDQANTGDATWIYQSYDTDPWANAGGDFADTASATTLVGSDLNVTYTWSTTAMVADVQGWVDNPRSNFGWLLMGDESLQGTFRTFWSREADLAGNGAYEPKLVIDYTAVPEPSSLVLFAGGAAALIMMRRVRRRSGIP